MRHSIIGKAVLTVLLLAFAALAVAQTLKGPVSDKPLDEKWAPSKWGANDRAGSANHTKNSANIARALATIKQNKAITIGKDYHRDAPAFGPRGWQMSIPGTPTGGPFGKNALIYHDELVTTEIGQIQTQFDGPGHIGVNTSKGPMMYNGVIAWDAYEHGAGGRVVGMGPLGVEHPGELGFVCRGVVLDAVADKKSKGVIPAGAEMLPIPTKPGDAGIVTADDVRGMLQMQGLRVPGGAGHRADHVRYVGVRRAALGGAGARLRGALPPRDADPPGHLEPGERRHQVARRQEDPRGRVHLGAAADHWRHRLARQSDGALLVEHGGPRNGPPYPPNARRAPAKPWRASTSNARRAPAKPWRASIPNARRTPAKLWRASTHTRSSRPGEAVARLDLQRSGRPGEAVAALDTPTASGARIALPA